MPSTGAAQMQHFYKNDNMNIFRLPVGWQYLTNNVVGGDLDSTNFGKYDELMQSCLDLGAKVRTSMTTFWPEHGPCGSSLMHISAIMDINGVKCLKKNRLTRSSSVCY